eukprot:COSAG02_NODE_577_length_20095_cov_6.816413_11_plen_44_part_00
MTLLRWVFAHGNAKRLKCPTCLQVSLVWRGQAARLPINYAVLQ